MHDQLVRTDPAYVAARVRSENSAWQARRSGGAARTGITVIPVVVHVVFRTAAQNISDEQVHSQIEVLNRDFRKANTDVGSTPAVFAPLAADARIEFELASTDPDGRATNGITRTRTSAASFTDDNAVKSARSGGVDAWPADRYLNLWVCQLGGGLLGYAQFPGGPPATDGVVILQSAFGTVGTAAAPFNLGRTATHEIGHWLNLRHIWGDDDSGCSGDDFVADTPNAAGPNRDVPVFPRVTCGNGPNGDLFMNYMDYTDDVAMFMFTTGQVTRMQACLDADRASIGHVKPGPKLKMADDPVTLKFSDDGVVGPTLKPVDDPKLKFADDVPPQTLKFRDDGITIKFLDDGGGGSLKFADDPHPPPPPPPPSKLKFRDDIITVKFSDDHGGGPIKPILDPTIKFSDDPKLKFVDDPVQKLPGTDPIGPPDQAPIGDPAPFVLSTPHHSRAWGRSFPGAYQQALASLEAQIGQYEQALQEYGQAQESGALTPQDAAAGEQLHGEYMRLVEEYRRLAGG